MQQELGKKTKKTTHNKNFFCPGKSCAASSLYILHKNQAPMNLNTGIVEVTHTHRVGDCHTLKKKKEKKKRKKNSKCKYSS